MSPVGGVPFAKGICPGAGPPLAGYPLLCSIIALKSQYCRQTVIAQVMSECIGIRGEGQPLSLLTKNCRLGFFGCMPANRRVEASLDQGVVCGMPKAARSSTNT